MPTVVDSLFVLFGMDASGLKKGSKEARNDLQGLKQESVEAGKTVKGLTRGLVDLFAVFLTGKGLSDFVSDVTRSNTELLRFSRHISATIPQIQNWGAIVARNGGSAQGFQSDLQMMSSDMTDFAVTGQSKLMPFFNQFGVHMQDFKDHADPAIDLLQALGDAVKNKVKSPENANNILAMMGYSQGTINTLMQGGDEVRRQLADQQRLNPITTEATEQSKRLSVAWVRFREAGEGVVRMLVDRLTPWLTTLLDKMSALEVYLREHPKLIAGLGIAMGVLLAPSLLSVLGILGLLVPAFGLLLGPIGLVAAGMGLIALAADDWKVWSEGGKSELGDFWQWWADLWHKISGSKNMVGKALGIALGVVKSTLAGIKEGYAMNGVGTAVLGGVSGLISGLQNATAKKGLLDGMIDLPAVRDSSDIYEKKQYLKNLERHYGLPDGILDKQWQRESHRGDPHFMKSSAGAEGHFGFMPATAKEYNLKNPYDFRQSGDAAGRKMRDLIHQYGGQDEALSAYNWGNGHMDKLLSAHPNNWRGYLPTETAGYVLANHVGAQSPENLVALQSVVNAAASRKSAGARGGNTHNRSTEMNIGQITVVTQATDARNIAAELPAALKSQHLVEQADYGQN